MPEYTPLSLQNVVFKCYCEQSLKTQHQVKFKKNKKLFSW